MGTKPDLDARSPASSVATTVSHVKNPDSRSTTGLDPCRDASRDRISGGTGARWQEGEELVSNGYMYSAERVE